MIRARIRRGHASDRRDMFGPPELVRSRGASCRSQPRPCRPGTRFENSARLQGSTPLKASRESATMSSIQYPSLLRPFRLRDVTFRNRGHEHQPCSRVRGGSAPEASVSALPRGEGEGRARADPCSAVRRTSRRTRHPPSARSTSATTRSFPCSGSSPSACTGTAAPSCARSRTWVTAPCGTWRTGCRRSPPRWCASMRIARSRRRWTATTSGGWCARSATPRGAARKAGSTARNCSPRGISSTSSGHRSSTAGPTSTAGASGTGPGSVWKCWRRYAGGSGTTSSSDSG